MEAFNETSSHHHQPHKLTVPDPEEVHTLTSPQFPYSTCTVLSLLQLQWRVAILINRKKNHTISYTVTEPQGRFIMLNVSIQNMDICMATIFGLNVDDTFFSAFFIF